MGLSRNKVAVPEGAAGSPPFYGVLWGARVASVSGRCVSRPCGGGGRPCWCGRDQGSVAGPVGRWWCGACCWVPGPPRPLCGVGVPRPWVRCGVFVVSCGLVVWWWFENWRVDASNGRIRLGVVGVRTVNEPRRIGPLWLVRPGRIPVVGCVCSFVCFVSAMPCCGVWLMCVMI